MVFNHFVLPGLRSVYQNCYGIQNYLNWIVFIRVILLLYSGYTLEGEKNYIKLKHH